jgi:enamine deaminase RidA (YjgF/YER057c/UK114 family)
MEKQLYWASDKLQPPVGLYSRAIRVGNLLFISGHAGFDKQGNVVGNGDAGAQTEQVLKNLEALLDEAGASWENVVRSTTYLVNAEDLPGTQEAKGRYWVAPYPTSASVVVTGLARPELLVEIDAIAVLPEPGQKLEKQILTASDKLHAPFGLYSRGIKCGGFVFVSGHAAFDKEGNVVGGRDAYAQAMRALQNLQYVLEEGGAGFENVVKSTGYLVNQDDMGKVKQAKQAYFRQPYPTSASVIVKRLANPDLLVEFEVIAAV